MPSHIIAVHLAIVLTPLAAILAGVYALFPAARAVLRWPMVASSIAALAALGWADFAGLTLLDAVTRAGNAQEIAAARAHEYLSNAVVMNVFTLVVEVAMFAWWLLRPRRANTAGSHIAAGLLALTSVATLVSLWIVAAAGLKAAWAS